MEFKIGNKVIIRKANSNEWVYGGDMGDYTPGMLIECNNLDNSFKVKSNHWMSLGSNQGSYAPKVETLFMKTK